MPTPLALEDGRACGLDVMRMSDAAYAPEVDRRRRVRVALSLPIYVFPDGSSEPLVGRTKNMSSEGFYCHLDHPFAIGEGVRVVIVVPGNDPRNRDRTLSLECFSRVVRVEAVDQKRFGIACLIENYRVAVSDHGHNFGASA
jgi:hypothetical protein